MIRLGALSILLAVLLSPFADAQEVETPPARGVVFLDENFNGVRDAGEKGLAGVCVSNMVEVVETDAQGRWQLPARDKTVFYVIKPRDYMMPLDENRIPQGYYIHDVKGAPRLRYTGIAPTGPLPASIDFPLMRHPESDRFDAVFFADTQIAKPGQQEYLAVDVVSELAGTKAAFGVTLGDLVFDNLDLYPFLTETMSGVGIPWFNVPGNHDQNYDAPGKGDHFSTFRRHFGPDYRAWNWGPVHFVALNNIRRTKKGKWTGGMWEEQRRWLANDLAHVPADRRVVLMMHVPLYSGHGGCLTAMISELNDLLKDRLHVVALSGHTHTHHHNWITARQGWKKGSPLEHAHIATACGAWWSGGVGERGVPFSLCQDGTPNGYVTAHFNGTAFSYQGKAAGYSPDEQIRVTVANRLWSDRLTRTYAYANVFFGSDRQNVLMRVDDGPYRQARRSLEPDPFYERLCEMVPDMKGPKTCLHLWRAPLPGKLRPGAHVIEVKSTDVYGRVSHGRRVFHVSDAKARPRVTRLSPTPIRPGAELRITGHNFTGPSHRVFFQRGSARAEIWARLDGDAVVVQVPEDVTPGRLTVRVGAYAMSEPVVYELAWAGPNGLRGEYYRFPEKGLKRWPDLAEGERAMVRRDETIDFESAKQMSLPFEATDFAARWTGKLRVETAGEYRFSLGSDDGSWLFIDGKPVVENGGAHAFALKRGSVRLEPGMHDVELRFWQGGGPCGLKWFWKVPGTEEAVPVPTSSLFHPEADRNEEF